jgi:hypothetical protein
MDWDKENNTWNYKVATDTDRLNDGIKYFKMTLDGFKCT